MLNGPSDEMLLRRASKGDETAFLLLYERHRTSVFRFAFRMLGSTELAEDVTHDCFLSLMKNPTRFDPSRAALGTYLYAAARNLALKYFRHHGSELNIEDAADELPPASTMEPLKALLDEELADEVRTAIAGLQPLQREALILFEYEELSLAQIATVVGVDVGTVKARLHRARKQIRRLLASYLKSEARIVVEEW